MGSHHSSLGVVFSKDRDAAIQPPKKKVENLFGSSYHGSW